jgi:hypothetical protein
MASSTCETPVKSIHADSTRHHVADGSVGGLVSQHLAVEYQCQLWNLQQCICDLLIRNQQLRMALAEQRLSQSGGQHTNGP